MIRSLLPPTPPAPQAAIPRTRSCRQLPVRRDQPHHRGGHAPDHDDAAHDRQRAGPRRRHDDQRAALRLADRAAVAPRAPAPAAASDANVGSVAATAAAATSATGPPVAAASHASPAKTTRSDARSPTSLSTNPHGRATPRARATAPSRLAPGQPGGERGQRPEPPALRDADGGDARRGHPDDGEHVRRDPPRHRQVDQSRQPARVPRLDRVEPVHGASPPAGRPPRIRGTTQAPSPGCPPERHMEHRRTGSALTVCRMRASGGAD